MALQIETNCFNVNKSDHFSTGNKNRLDFDLEFPILLRNLEDRGYEELGLNVITDYFPLVKQEGIK